MRRDFPVKGAPPLQHQILDQIDVVLKSVDQRGREIEQRWGVGRLSALVPIEIADKFRAQQRKFSAAIWERNVDDVRKHGEAMLRAYAKLEELAIAAGHSVVPPEQWEFETPDGLVVLVRDIRDTGRVELGGRKAAVWSLDEIASVIRNHPVLAAAKSFFPGATVESVRPAKGLQTMTDDGLNDIPGFAA